MTALKLNNIQQRFIARARVCVFVCVCVGGPSKFFVEIVSRYYDYRITPNYRISERGKNSTEQHPDDTFEVEIRVPCPSESRVSSRFVNTWPRCPSRPSYYLTMALRCLQTVTITHSILFASYVYYLYLEYTGRYRKMKNMQDPRRAAERSQASEW